MQMFLDLSKALYKQDLVSRKHVSKYCIPGTMLTFFSDYSSQIVSPKVSFSIIFFDLQGDTKGKHITVRGWDD